MTRRTAKLAAVYLLLGLAATWAVAWGSACLWQIYRTQVRAFESAGPPHRVVTPGEGLGGVSIELWGCVSGYTYATVPSAINRTNAIFVTEYSLPHIASGLASYDARGLTNRTIEVIARGWPWPAASSNVLLNQTDFDAIALAGEEEYWRRPVRLGPDGHPPRGSFESHGAVVIPSQLAGGANNNMSAILLPYLPYWPGLLADTLFYALLFAALHQLTAYARRTRRRRRNRCTACGYDLQGLNSPTCPECGRALSPAHRATATPHRA